MNVVDSSGWLSYFANDGNAAVFAKPIEQVQALVVPAITIAEVFKRVLQQRDEHAALQAVAHMNQGAVIALDAGLAMQAGKLEHALKLPLADSIILATAQRHEALLWTQDEDFKLLNLPGIRYIPTR